MPRVLAHQLTTRNLGAAYPFIAEAGLGRRGVVLGETLLGGSFVFDPFELYAAGVVSNPNMAVLACDRQRCKEILITGPRLGLGRNLDVGSAPPLPPTPWSPCQVMGGMGRPPRLTPRC
jgi:hypothetical protein